jgi:mRNA-degrading endonuclease toxin of MazEF toxin-antitoxin module
MVQRLDSQPLYRPVELRHGLRRPSVALVFQLTALDRRILGAQLGRIDANGLEQMWAVESVPYLRKYIQN